MSQRIEFIVYFIGILVLGAVYYAVKSELSAPVFVISVLAYLVALRVVGRYLRHKMEAREANVAGSSDISH